MVTQESQKKHPFGLSEKRFRWNKVSNGNDIRLFAHKFINKKKDNLEGGLGKFLNQTDQSTFQSIYARKQKYAQNNNSIKTGRVINPILNTEKMLDTVNHKKRSASTESNRHNTDGSFISLMKRTPSSFKVKGKKRVNTSVDGKKNEHGIFTKEFLFDKNCNGLFGVSRKMKRRHSSEFTSSIFSNETCNNNCKPPSRRRCYPLSTQATLDHLSQF